MKKLLTTITLSALVGTSTSNLKPMFAEKIVNIGFKSNQINNKDTSIKYENDTNPFSIKKLGNDFDKSTVITSEIAPNGIIWVVTTNGLYKSTDGINFEQVTNGLGTPKYLNSITIFFQDMYPK